MSVAVIASGCDPVRQLQQQFKVSPRWVSRERFHSRKLDAHLKILDLDFESVALQTLSHSSVFY
jgi:hypothetical protein